jgi:aspartyl protease family protein
MNRLFWILMAVIGVGAALLMFNDSAGSTMGVENYDFGRLIWLGAFAALIGSVMGGNRARADRRLSISL